MTSEKKDYNEGVKAPLFRKILSTIVETALEKYTRKSIWNFRNNIIQAIDQAPWMEQIAIEARELLKDDPQEIDAIIEEMGLWYTGNDGRSKESYEPEVVAIFCEEITTIFVSALGSSSSLVLRLSEFEQRGRRIKE
jgi:hypothetical protein